MGIDKNVFVVNMLFLCVRTAHAGFISPSMTTAMWCGVSDAVAGIWISSFRVSVRVSVQVSPPGE